MLSPYFFKQWKWGKNLSGRACSLSRTEQTYSQKRLWCLQKYKNSRISCILLHNFLACVIFLFVPLQCLSTIRMGFEARFGKIQFGASRIYKTSFGFFWYYPYIYRSFWSVLFPDFYLGIFKPEYGVLFPDMIIYTKTERKSKLDVFLWAREPPERVGGNRNLYGCQFLSQRA